MDKKSSCFSELSLALLACLALLDYFNKGIDKIAYSMFYSFTLTLHPGVYTNRPIHCTVDAPTSVVSAERIRSELMRFKVLYLSSLIILDDSR